MHILSNEDTGFGLDEPRLNSTRFQNLRFVGDLLWVPKCIANVFEERSGLGDPKKML
jgi:hypothetical protein